MNRVINKEPIFEWTIDKAQNFLQERNRIYWGDRYNDAERLDFEGPHVSFQITFILESLTVHGVQTHQIISSKQIGIASVLRRVSGEWSERMYGESDINDNLSEAYLDIAMLVISAAEFLGIEIYPEDRPGLDLKL